MFCTTSQGCWSWMEKISSGRMHFWVCQSHPPPPLDQPSICEVFFSFLFMFFSLCSSIYLPQFEKLNQNKLIYGQWKQKPLVIGQWKPNPQLTHKKQMNFTISICIITKRPCESIPKFTNMQILSSTLQVRKVIYMPNVNQNPN